MKSQSQRKIFSHRDEFGHGIRKIKDQNCGIYLTEKTMATLKFFQFLTGQKWMVGIHKENRTAKPLFFSSKRGRIRDNVILAPNFIQVRDNEEVKKLTVV